MKMVTAIATRGNDLVTDLVQYLISITVKLGSNHTVMFSQSRYSAYDAQENMFKKLTELEWDYVLLVDSDVGPTMESLGKMFTLDKDMVTAPIWYFNHKHNDLHMNIFDPDNGLDRAYNYHPQAIAEKVLSTSFGMVLIKRKVIDAFVERGEPFVRWSPVVPEKSKTAESDYQFFYKAREFGFELWVDWSIKDIYHHRFINLGYETIERLAHCKGKFVYEKVEVKE